LSAKAHCNTTTFDVTAGAPREASGADGKLAVNDYWLVIRPGDTNEIAQASCGMNRQTVQTSFWSGRFKKSRFQRFNWKLAGFEVTGWTIVNQGKVVATTTMKTNCSGICSEVTTMTLKRNPEQ
jgi:hypothetical protein